MTIGSVGQVDYSNLFSKPYANLYALLNNRTNVPDPSDTIGTKRKFVYTRIPNIYSRNSDKFPFIVLKRVKPNKANLTLDSGKGKYTFEFTILVYTIDLESDSSGNQKGAEWNETISNNLVKTLDDKTNKNTLRSYGMVNMRYSSNPDEDELEGITVFKNEFTITFDAVLANSV